MTDTIYDAEYHAWLRKKQTAYKKWIDSAKSEDLEPFNSWMIGQLWEAEKRIAGMKQKGASNERTD